MWTGAKEYENRIDVTGMKTPELQKENLLPPCVFCSVRAFVIRHSRKLAVSRLRQSLGGGNELKPHDESLAWSVQFFSEGSGFFTSYITYSVSIRIPCAQSKIASLARGR